MLNSPNSYDRIEALAISLSLHDGYSHTGFLYRNGTQLFALHLAGPEQLLNQKAETINFRWTAVTLHKSLLRTIAMRCQVIAFRQSGIPYGFGYDGLPCFDGKGRYNRPDSQGMTCATFVMDLFHSNAIPILQLEGWPLRSQDKDFQSALRELIRKAKMYEVRGIDTSPRYRPEEVAGGALSTEKPLPFTVAEALGRTLREQLEASY